MLNNITFSAGAPRIGTVRFGQNNAPVLSELEQKVVQNIREYDMDEVMGDNAAYAAWLWKLVEGLSRREQEAPQTVEAYREQVKSQLYSSSTWDEIERLNRENSLEKIREINRDIHSRYGDSIYNSQLW